MVPGWHYAVPATVSTYAGEGAYGPAVAAPVTVNCRVDGRRKLVRSAAGDEVVSETTLLLPPSCRSAAGAQVVPEDLFTPESQVTVRGRTSQVISTQAHLEGVSVVYVEVTLT